MSPLSHFLSRRPALYLGLLLVCIALIVHAPACGCAFLNYDDDDYVTRNGNVQDGLTWSTVRWALWSTEAANWHPITWISLALDHEQYGLCPWGYHFGNVLLHAVNTFLLFALWGKLTGAWGRSAVVAGLFAVHPLRIESVAWVAERKDVLCAFFFMLCLLAYVRYTRRPSLGRYVWVALAFGAGLAAKPMLVTVPCVLLLLDYWPLGRLSAMRTRGFTRGYFPVPAVSRAQIAAEKLPLWLFSGASSAVTVYAQQRGQALVSLDQVSFGDRMANAAVNYIEYIRKLIWPTDLAPFYPYRSWQSYAFESWEYWQPYLAAILVILLTMGAIRRAPRQPYLLVGWLWYLVTLIPVIGIVQVGPQGMADRYTYIPSIGLILLATWTVADALMQWQIGPAPAVILAGAGLLACVGISRAQLRNWQDSVKLWMHTRDEIGANYKVENNLGTALEEAGAARGGWDGTMLIEKAKEHYQKAVPLDPHRPDAEYNLGRAWARQGQFGQAEKHFRSALVIDRGFAKAHNNLAQVLCELGREQEGIAEYREAIRLDPHYALARNNLGRRLLDRGRDAEAIEQLRAAVEQAPRFSLAITNLGRALALQGNFAEAAEWFDHAAALHPQAAEPRYHLAHALRALGRTADATRTYELARLLDPHWPERARREAWQLATDPNPHQRNGKAAVWLAEQARDALGTGHALAEDTLAAAYAEAGRFDDAAAAASRALAAPGVAPDMVDALRARLELYKSHHPYRAPRVGG